MKNDKEIEFQNEKKMQMINLLEEQDLSFYIYQSYNVAILVPAEYEEVAIVDKKNNYWNH